ncbi:TIGR03066 family protein [Frigoriglobus tundricola]|uniref:Lipocalin-like domain-containing protein n=1 Tax=Frigoriglobus tundricola TaxID=2774151 RepID=A0A6M5YGK9_9BACT|nr:TIGR03066 family protein [Frigoriglobus tundricola]QJW92724.1 hypothetical protein FTUN_0221 [Frigoriglobus tundricola]
MRVVLSCSLGLLVCCALSADDKKDEKIDAQKLVGKWLHEDKDKSRAVVEFTKDGKVTMALTFKDETLKVEGTYKVEGAKIAMVLKEDGKERRKRPRSPNSLTPSW